MARATRAACLAALLAVTFAAGTADLPPLPDACAPFSLVNGATQECPLALWEGYTYAIYTSCDSVKGDTMLNLYDQKGTLVAGNDDFPFCAADLSASLIKWTMPCGAGALGAFNLVQSCYGDSACAAQVQVVYNTSVPVVSCTPPPPSTPAPTPTPAGGAPPPPGFCGVTCAGTADCLALGGTCNLCVSRVCAGLARCRLAD